MKFFIPKPGDTVRVRLHTGEVVDAKYDRPRTIGNKEHWVIINGLDYIATKSPDITRVRFIGPSCDLVPS